MPVYTVTTNLVCLWSFNWGSLHCFPPRGPVSTTSFLVGEEAGDRTVAGQNQRAGYCTGSAREEDCG